jgi:hypothetical protein
LDLNLSWRLDYVTRARRGVGATLELKGGAEEEKSFVVAENLLKQMGQGWTTAEIKDVAAFDCVSYLYNFRRVGCGIAATN